MLSLFIYEEFTTSSTRYITNNIFPTSFKNLNRNLYVNLENSNFMLTTTTHLVLLQNESSNPQNGMLNTQLFQYFVVWDTISTKRITMFEKQILRSGKRQSVNKESTWHASHFILLFSNGNKTTWSETLKTKVAFEFELVCRIAWLNHYSSEIVVDYDFRMRKKPAKFINLQRIYVMMFIPALSWDRLRVGNSVISQKNMHDV